MSSDTESPMKRRNTQSLVNQQLSNQQQAIAHLTDIQTQLARFAVLHVQPNFISDRRMGEWDQLVIHYEAAKEAVENLANVTTHYYDNTTKLNMMSYISPHIFRLIMAQLIVPDADKPDHALIAIFRLGLTCRKLYQRMAQDPIRSIMVESYINAIELIYAQSDTNVKLIKFSNHQMYISQYGCQRIFNVIPYQHPRHYKTITIKKQCSNGQVRVYGNSLLKSHDDFFQYGRHNISVTMTVAPSIFRYVIKISATGKWQQITKSTIKTTISNINDNYGVIKKINGVNPDVAISTHNYFNKYKRRLRPIMCFLIKVVPVFTT